MLLDLIGGISSSRPAIVLPESGTSITRHELVDRIRAFARERSAPASSSIEAEAPVPTNHLSILVSILGAAIGRDGTVLLRTRGTTGSPKAIRLSSDRIAAGAIAAARSLALGTDDVSMCVMPIAHVHGLVVSTLAPLVSGGIVVLPERFNPLAFWRIARDHGATWFSADPRRHQMLLARSADPAARRPAGAARLRLIRSSGAVLPAPVFTTLESAFGAPVIEAYDVAEAGGPVASNPLPPEPRKPGSVGRVLEGLTVAVVDAAGNEQPAGHRGQLVVCVGGDRIETGDAGWFDAEGFLTIGSA